MASTLLTGLTNYWLLDETSGNAVDIVGGNNGVNTNVTYSIGKINNGAVYPAAHDGNLELGSQVNPTSFAFWVNGTQFFMGGNGYSVFASTSPDNTVQAQATTGLILIYDGTNRVGVNTWTTGTWTHYVFVFTTSGGNGYDIYRNGVFLERIASNQVQIRRIGRGALNNSFVGTIDEIGCWSKALSTAEITELYNAGGGVHYPFNSTQAPFLVS